MPTPLSLEDRLALMDRAQTLELAERARQDREAVVAQLVADCAAQGLVVSRPSVEQAVTDLVTQAEAARRTPSVLDGAIKGVVVIGLVLVGLFALRVLVPLIERLLAPVL